MDEKELLRIQLRYLAERVEGESPDRWVKRAYPAWPPLVQFGVSVVIRQQIDE